MSKVCDIKVQLSNTRSYTSDTQQYQYTMQLVATLLLSNNKFKKRFWAAILVCLNAACISLNIYRKQCMVLYNVVFCFTCIFLQNKGHRGGITTITTATDNDDNVFVWLLNHLIYYIKSLLFATAYTQLNITLYITRTLYKCQKCFTLLFCYSSFERIRLLLGVI